MECHAAVILVYIVLNFVENRFDGRQAANLSPTHHSRFAAKLYIADLHTDFHRCSKHRDELFFDLLLN